MSVDDLHIPAQLTKFNLMSFPSMFIHVSRSADDDANIVPRGLRADEK